MPGDWRKKFSIGDEWHPTATWVNNVTDVAVDYQQNGLGQSAAARLPRLRDGIILAQNNSGDDVDAFGVLGIDSVLVTPSIDLQQFQFSPAVAGITPARPTHIGKFVVAAEAIADGDIGRAYIAGYCSVQITGTNQGFADITDSDSTQLTCAAFGSAQVLYAPGGSGTRWAIVRIGALSGAAFLCDLAYNSGGTGSVGSTNSASAATYDVSVGGVTLATNQTVTFSRPFAGEASKATHGLICFQGSNVNLILVDEQAGGEQCP